MDLPKKLRRAPEATRNAWLKREIASRDHASHDDKRSGVYQGTAMPAVHDLGGQPAGFGRAMSDAAESAGNNAPRKRPQGDE
jgi:hypothetical protein